MKEPPNVYVEEIDLGPVLLYRVMVDYQLYDEFSCQKKFMGSLTWAQQKDVASYYREALTHYEGIIYA